MKRHANTIVRIGLFSVVCTLPAPARVPNHHVFYERDYRAPVTTLEIVFLGAGRSAVGPSKTGLAVTAAALIEDYSKEHGYTARLETLGARLKVRTYFRYQTMDLSCLSGNFEASVGIVNDLMRRMAVTGPALEETKGKLRRSYEKTVDSGSHDILRNYALARSVGVGKWFSREAMKQITLEDVSEYCARFLNAEVVFFKAVSNLDSTEVDASLRPITGDRRQEGFVWSPGTPKAERLPGHSAFVFEHYSHLKNVYCYWLIPIGTVGEENYIPNMVSWTLGRGGTRGLLFKQLREEAGLVYGTSCSYLSEDDVRFLEISADPRLENSEELLTSVQEMIVGLADRPDFWTSIAQLRENPDAIEAHLHGEYAPRRKLNRAVDRAIFNYPSRADGIKSVTDAEIRSFLEKYFVTENMVLMLFGPKDHIIEILERHWPDITIHVQPVEKAIE